MIMFFIWSIKEIWGEVNNWENNLKNWLFEEHSE